MPGPQQTFPRASWWSYLVRLIINSQMDEVLDRDRTAITQPFAPGISCGVDLSTALQIEPDLDQGFDSDACPPVEFGQPLQDWFEMALQVATPVRPSVKNSWGEDEEEGDEEIPGEDVDDEEQDPFEDFDEDDFDDDFDDDFEEELDDEYEIEPADDGLVPATSEDLDEEILDEDEEIEPGVDDLD
jgi:hypothetical protein